MLIGTVSFATLGFVAAFAYVAARQTERQRGKMPKSALAASKSHWTVEKVRARRNWTATSTR